MKQCVIENPLIFVFMEASMKAKEMVSWCWSE